MRPILFLIFVTLSSISWAKKAHVCHLDKLYSYYFLPNKVQISHSAYPSVVLNEKGQVFIDDQFQSSTSREKRQLARVYSKLRRSFEIQKEQTLSKLEIALLDEMISYIEDRPELYFSMTEIKNVVDEAREHISETLDNERAPVSFYAFDLANQAYLKEFSKRINRFENVVDKRRDENKLLSIKEISTLERRKEHLLQLDQAYTTQLCKNVQRISVAMEELVEGPWPRQIDLVEDAIIEVF